MQGARPDARPSLRILPAGVVLIKTESHLPNETLGTCVILALVALLLTACATAEPYNGSNEVAAEILETWMGATEADAVERWGPPDNSYLAEDGARILKWQHGELCASELTIKGGVVVATSVSSACEAKPPASADPLYRAS